jgi:hypothetical protein
MQRVSLHQHPFKIDASRSWRKAWISAMASVA